MLLSLFGIIFYANHMERALHNVDLIVNLTKDNNKFFNMTDIVQDGRIFTMSNLYIASMIFLRKTYLYIGICTFAFGFLLCKLIETPQKPRGD